MEKSAREQLDKDFLAAVAGDKNRVNQLLQCDAHTSAYWLHRATQEEHFELINQIVNVGVDVNAKNSAGYTALHTASAAGRVEVVRLLLSLQANVDASVASSFETPLHLAAQNDHFECAQMLINASANINAVSSSGESVLFFAARARTPKLLEFLLKSGICGPRARCLRLTSRDGGSLLHVAASHARPRNLSLLLELKGDVMINSRRSELLTTPFLAACSADAAKANQEALANLELTDGDSSSFAVGSNSIRSAADDPIIECLQLLIAAKADTQATASTRSQVTWSGGLCGLHFAADRGNASVIRFLCERQIGGGIEQRSAPGYDHTPLSLAVRNCNVEATRALLQCRADVDAEEVEMSLEFPRY